MTHAVVDDSRITQLNDQPFNQDGKCVVYWMQKDQRSRDNWALLRAAELANGHKVPLVVTFFVWEKFKNAYVRHFDFMLRGLSEVASDLANQQIGFVMRHEEPVAGIVKLAREEQAVAVVTDQAYLRLAKWRRKRAAVELNCAFEAVDAAMIVPPKVLSEKQLFAAHIARPKLHNHMDQYLTDYPELEVKTPWQGKLEGLDVSDTKAILSRLDLDDSSAPVRQEAGMAAGKAALQEFIADRAGAYSETAHDPMAFGTSRLSAYLHYGQLSAQRVAWELKHASGYAKDRDSINKYLDELITWRELSTNFTVYNTHYDSYAGVPDWAKKTLDAHEADEREFTYTRDEFEQAKTHDELWNAAQMEMVKSGRMHGYLRMYWAKKILEWTKSAEEAITIAVYLNDKYELDGREPNGYTGILWAIGGLHDRPWFERDVYGQIRYMNANGAKKKFKVADYITWVNELD